MGILYIKYIGMFKPELTPSECYTNLSTLGEKEHVEQGTLFSQKLHLCILNYLGNNRVDNEVIDNTSIQVVVGTSKSRGKAVEKIVISILKNEYD